MGEREVDGWWERRRRETLREGERRMAELPPKKDESRGRQEKAEMRAEDRVWRGGEDKTSVISP